ncbi:MAG: hypothetical protein WCK98_05545 [bacterium]
MYQVELSDEEIIKNGPVAIQIFHEILIEKFIGKSVSKKKDDVEKSSGVSKIIENITTQYNLLANIDSKTISLAIKELNDGQTDGQNLAYIFENVLKSEFQEIAIVSKFSPPECQKLKQILENYLKESLNFIPELTQDSPIFQDYYEQFKSASDAFYLEDSKEKLQSLSLKNIPDKNIKKSSLQYIFLDFLSQQTGFNLLEESAAIIKPSALYFIFKAIINRTLNREAKIISEEESFNFPENIVLEYSGIDEHKLAADNPSLSKRISNLIFSLSKIGSLDGYWAAAFRRPPDVPKYGMHKLQGLKSVRSMASKLPKNHASFKFYGTGIRLLAYQNESSSTINVVVGDYHDSL